jgi:hypothetical protein
MPFRKKQLISNISSLLFLSILLLNWWSLSRWPLCSDPFNRSKEQMQTWTYNYKNEDIIPWFISLTGEPIKHGGCTDSNDSVVSYESRNGLVLWLFWGFVCVFRLIILASSKFYIDATATSKRAPRWNCLCYLFVNIVQGVGCWHLVQNSLPTSIFPSSWRFK